MTNFLLIVQIIIAILLVVVILLQVKGVGLGSTFGGGGEFYKTKRGVEKVIFTATIVLAVLFFLASLAVFIIS